MKQCSRLQSAILPSLKTSPDYLDICALMATDIQFRFLSKASVFKIPLIGSAMNLAGYVPIERGIKGSHKIALEKSADWIRKGIPMVFYPEGTRSLDGKIAPFKLGAFRLARSTKSPISPIVLKGTNELMKKNSFVPKAAHVIVDIMPLVEVSESESEESLSEKVRSQMIAKLSSL